MDDANAQNANPEDSSEESSDLASLTEMIRRFSAERDWDQFHTTRDMAIGLITESAELLEIFRFKTEDECAALFTDARTREKIEDEVADVLFWILRFADRNKIDLARAFKAKMKKNAAKYPADKVRGSNRKYDEY